MGKMQAVKDKMAENALQAYFSHFCLTHPNMDFQFVPYTLFSQLTGFEGSHHGDSGNYSFCYFSNKHWRGRVSTKMTTNLPFPP